MLEADFTEEEIVPTLAFARHAEALWDIRDPERRAATARQLVAKYPAFDLVEVADGVPVLRMKPALVEVERYQNSNLAKSVRMRVLSGFAKPDALAKLYWDVCEREALPIHETSPGSLSWIFDQMHLVIDVGPREEIEPALVDQYAEYPQDRRVAFPLDTVVGALVRALLGHGQKKNQMFMPLLTDLGRHKKDHMSPKAVVTACVLWDLRGERNPPRVQRSEEAAKLVNRFLLEPVNEEPMTVSRNEAIWRNASKISQRFDLCKYLLQENIGRDN